MFKKFTLGGKLPKLPKLNFKKEKVDKKVKAAKQKIEVRKEKLAQKSIRNKMIFVMVSSVLVSLCAVGGISSYLLYSSTITTLEKTLSQTAVIVSENVSEEIENYKKTVFDISKNTLLRSISPTVKENYLKSQTSQFGFLDFGYADQQGQSFFNSKNFASEEYFIRAKEGKAFVSEPFFSEAYNKVVMVFSSPVSSTENVVFFVADVQFLADIANEIAMGEGGMTYILDKNGTVIAHPDEAMVHGRQNSIEAAKSDSSMAKLAEMEQKMINGESGSGTFNFNGVSKFAAYVPVPGTDGWSLATCVAQSDFLGSTIISLTINVALVILAIIISTILAITSTNVIIRPIRELVSASRRLSQGDLDIEITVKSKDELGALADSFRDTISSLQVYIRDISRVLGAMAAGDFNAEIETEFKGEFAELKESINHIRQSLSKALYYINQSADQVTYGSEQVASGSQALSQGATEQAGSIEELSATIGMISAQINQTAENAATASSKAIASGQEIQESNHQMTLLVDAMREISASSGKIGKIIKTIEDIAFQTNILALNAAVEAARAGAAGKGFAVVADEVRNLASKSAEAAKNTTELIDGSIRAVSKGEKMVTAAAKSLEIVVEESQDIAASMELISRAANEQATAISQVTMGVEQISAVVQTNSATAEQSAAASEELHSQSQILKQLVGDFKLCDVGENKPSAKKAAAQAPQLETAGSKY